MYGLSSGWQRAGNLKHVLELGKVPYKSSLSQAAEQTYFAAYSLAQCPILYLPLPEYNFENSALGFVP